MNFLITGANRGIGLALTQIALKDGHSVYALVRNPAKAEALIQLKNVAADKLQILKTDVCSNQDLTNAQKDLNDVDLDVVINNAGVLNHGEKNFRDLSLDEIQSVFSVNTFAPLKVAQIFLTNLKQAAHPKFISITSLMGSIADNSSGGYYAYRMSKTALNMFAKSFSIDEPGIVTLVLHPGWVRTEMGGPQAPVEPLESAQGLYKVIMNATLKNSGRFYDFKGKELPW